MSKSILIQGGTVVNADREFKADVLCVDGVIAAVGDDAAMVEVAGLRHQLHDDGHPRRGVKRRPTGW